MTKRRCLSHGNRATHMEAIKATCGCGVIVAEVVFHSAWRSVLVHRSDQLSVQQIFHIRHPKLRGRSFIGSNQRLKCSQDRKYWCFSLSSSECMTATDLKNICPKQTCWSNCFRLRGRDLQTTIYTHATLLSLFSLYLSILTFHSYCQSWCLRSMRSADALNVR